MNWTRCAIVGTAQSWNLTPWNDPGLTILSLNDAYSLQGFQRADAWYDFHPLNKFIYQPTDRRLYAHEVPPGHYVRPATHLEWLAKLAIPAFLHPEYATQHPEAATWRHARPFPKAEIEGYFGRYFTSSPAWMMAHAIMHGCRELHIYGIHLATEHEYIEQRPNFEFLIGRMLGPQKVTMTVKDGVRIYQSPDAKVLLPEASPILASDFQYAFEPRPRAALEPLRWELHKTQIKRERIIDAFKRSPNAQTLTVTLPPEEPNGTPTVKELSTQAAQEELWYLDALMADWQEQLQRQTLRWSA